MTTATQSVTEQRISIAEYLTHEANSGGLVELIDGMIAPMTQGTGKHGAIIEFLNDEFRAEIKRSKYPLTSKDMKIAVQSPRGTRWETARVPDVVVLPQEQWQGLANREAFIPLNEPPPLLVVEVVSPSTIATDYRTKYTEYAVLDIPEYWIVDPLEHKITICTLLEGSYTDQVFIEQQQITSPTFPKLNLSPQQVFAAT